MNTIVPFNYNSYSLLKNEYQILFFNNLKKYLKFICLINHDYIIKSYFFKYKLNIKNITSLQIIDCLQTYNYLVHIKIPFLIKNYNNKNFNYKIFLYYIIPFINQNGIFILNGIKRFLVPHFIKYESIYLTIYNKHFINIYVLNILFYKYKILVNIELDITTFNIYFISFLLNTKINFIYLLYFLNINNKIIATLSNYGQSFFLKKILSNSYKLFKFSKLNKNFKFFYKLLKINFKTYNFLQQNNTINIELIKLLDILLDFFLNKKFNNSDHLGNKKINISIEHLYNFIDTYNIFILQNIKNLIFNYKIKKNYYFNLYKEFLLLNPLFRILEETNIISELSGLLKIGNYNFNTTLFSIRDFKLNYINNLCIINTTEGPTSGLILSMTLNTFYNKKNKCLSTYFQSDKYYYSSTLKDINKQEQEKIILSHYSNKKFNYFNKFILPIIWYYNFSLTTIKQKKTLNINLKSIIGLAENLVPFIFFTDPTRCLMGAKMQTQVLPILGSRKAYILTGIENYILHLNSDSTYALQEGVVFYVSSFKVILRDIFNREVIYYLNKYKTTNQSTSKHSCPLVWAGERVTVGQLLASNNTIRDNELSLGYPTKVIYGSYFGYDYEDSLIISQQLLYNNIFTSLHIYIYETYYKFYDNYYEFSSLMIPKSSLYFKRHLNTYGIIKEGVKVLYNDIIISKIFKTQIYIHTNILNNLVLLLFGNIIYNVSNISIKNIKNTCGRVLKVELFFKQYLYARIFIGNIHMLEIGDKLCGRHGNKGIISYIAKNTDLPYMQYGDFPDIIAGTLGIPSRMNLGQLYEGLFSINNFYLNTRLIVDNINNNLLGENYLKYLLYENLQKASLKTSYSLIYNEYDPGRVYLRDGRSGEKLKGTMCLGILQYFKLIHMVKDKVQSRTIGNYTYVTQQPVKGKSRQGGQRFGEMEVWSLEAFGAAYSLKELLTSRSDDTRARQSLYNMLSHNNEFLDKTSMSEPFKIILKELQSLALNINLFVLYPNLYYKMKKILI